ncbi:MAG: hypothetical protein ACI4QA_02440 [Candidatus Spyradosoma sp.]
MSEAFKCDICGAPATVHLTQIIDGKTRKVHLCEKCAAKQNAPELSVIKFAEMLTKKLFGDKVGSEILKGAIEIFEKKQNGVETKCPNCGLSETDFLKNERFGCARCYDVFSDALGMILPKLQHAVSMEGIAAEAVSASAGGAPEETPAAAPEAETTEALEKRLRAAVEKEDYALAAKLRDALRERRKTAAAGTPKKPRARARKSPSAAEKSSEKSGRTAPRSRRKGKSQ